MKPKILLLHGSGTNASIFGLQSRKLAALLQPHFDLVYLDAPTPCPPGPGVLPFFEGCEPYLTWMDDSGAVPEQAYWEGEAFEKLVGEVRGLMALEEEEGGLVGVVGFSMGAKVGMEVVRRLEADDNIEEGGEKGKTGGGVKVVVAVCGTVPFRGGVASSTTAASEGDEAREKAYRASLDKGRVKAESVHLIGDGDPWRAEGEKLVEFFEDEGRRVIRFRGAHHMPADDAVNRQVVRVILAACKGV
ncbi:serine hydrolase FSH [Chaetomidium leptoderma]|uniref:Serine hydrolase FSH n=1 Tax=Chaetomidium leptoderma TaxID=669021 RepID=A0AAN6VR15_9PEZI|nr:serine hydrolase FSH [Chaetomidium leptoderma]